MLDDIGLEIRGYSLIPFSLARICSKCTSISERRIGELIIGILLLILDDIAYVT